MSDLHSTATNVRVSSKNERYVVSTAPTGDIFSLVDNYSNQPIGSTPDGWTATESVIAADPENSNRHVIKHSISKGTSKGDAGVGSWGGDIKYPTDLVKGNTLYVSIKMWFPQSFGLNQAVPDLKFIRSRTWTKDGDNRGYLDWYLRNPGQNDPYFFIYEGANSVGQDKIKNGTGELLRASWHQYEYEIVLDSVPSNQGGNGHVKTWVDGQKIVDQGFITLFRDTDYCDRTLILSYWNNADSVPENSGPDSDQFCYSDELIILGKN